MKVAGKRVIITGGASGIGEASARRFAAEGARVAIVDLDERRGAALAQELASDGQDARFLAADVADEERIHAVVDAVARDLGGIDVLHNNAGMVAGSDAVSTDVADWDRTHAVNVRAPWLWSKHVIPHMREAGAGAIVYTGSTSGIVGFPA